jgi:hypothetical protein
MSTGLLCGYGIHGSCEEGGVLYCVEFVNNSDQNASIEYLTEGVETLPEGFSARILNLETMRYEETGSAGSLSIAAQSSGKRVVAVGNEEYFDAVLKQFTPWSLQFVKAYPNPFRGCIRLHYTLPEGVKEVRFALYDMRGRGLWKGVENRCTGKGPHLLMYDGRTGGSLGGYLSSGMYIMRMSAVNNEGRVIYGGERKITCIK